jgi:predicted phosphodiesterase
MHRWLLKFVLGILLSCYHQLRKSPYLVEEQMVSFLKKEDASEFVARIGKGLERAYRDTLQNDVSLDIKTAKIIIFSDHHRGLRNGADDFRLTEHIYHAALAYYFNMGHTLITLGDVEELWEEHPEPVVKTNEYSFGLERHFHEAEGNRYYRVWGNHDDEWRDEKRVRQLLQPRYGEKPLRTFEGLHIHVKDGEKELGRLFLTHGHQGTLDSDVELDGKKNPLAAASKWAVHNLWRNVQRLIKISVNTPARDFDLSDRHDQAMYAWAAAQKDTILITGHTHKPVFASQEHLARLQKEWEAAQKSLALTPPDPDAQQKLSEIAARVEWLKSKRKKTDSKPAFGEESRPCYFNTGCCSFADGDITGLEIVNGAIRLVRWPDDNGNPLPKILQTMNLSEIFVELTTQI